MVSDDCIRIIGIDPGSRHIGIAVMDVAIDDFKIRSIETHTLSTDAFECMANTAVGFPDSYARIFNIYEQILGILRYYSPTDVASESPFFGKRSPVAYGVLSEAFGAIKKAVYDFSPFIRFYQYPPATCKKTVNIKAVENKSNLTSKEIMYKAVYRLDLEVSLDLDSMSEHEIDALSVALTHKNFLWNNQYLLYVT